MLKAGCEIRQEKKYVCEGRRKPVEVVDGNSEEQAAESMSPLNETAVVY